MTQQTNSAAKSRLLAGFTPMTSPEIRLLLKDLYVKIDELTAAIKEITNGSDKVASDRPATNRLSRKNISTTDV